MGVTRTVQFRNAEQVLAAYIDCEMPAWSIWIGPQFTAFKYEGNDMSEGEAKLSDILKVLGMSAAIYTLKLYDGVPGKKIKSNTPDDGSFNFRFQDEPGAYGTAGNSQMNELLTEIKTMKLQLQDLQEDDGEQEDDVIGQIGRVMEMPGVPQLLGKFLGMNLMGAPTALAGVPGSVSTLQEALQILQEKDPLFPEHMIKLATLARDEPAKFTQIISLMKFV